MIVRCEANASMFMYLVYYCKMAGPLQNLFFLGEKLQSVYLSLLKKKGF